MKPIDTLTAGIAAMLLGALLVVGSGTSFGAHSGVVVFCYGLFAVVYVCWKKVF